MTLKDKEEFKHRVYKIIKCDGFDYVYAKSSIGRLYSGELTQIQLEEWIKSREELNWESLDAFNVLHHSIIETIIPSETSLEMLELCRCSCTSFFKNQKCKHIIAHLSVKKLSMVKVLEIPQKFKRKNIEKK